MAMRTAASGPLGWAASRECTASGRVMVSCMVQVVVVGEGSIARISLRLRVTGVTGCYKKGVLRF